MEQKQKNYEFSLFLKFCGDDFEDVLTRINSHWTIQLDLDYALDSLRRLRVKLPSRSHALLRAGTWANREHQSLVSAH